LGLLNGSAMASDDLIKRVKDAGVLRVCEADYWPDNFKDPKTNEWQGFNIDIAQKIAEALNVKLEHVDANWGTIAQSVVTGKCDMSVAGTYITPQRAELVLFTDPVSVGAITAFVKQDSKLDKWIDIDKQGIVVGVYAGAYEETVAKSFFKNAEVKPIVTDKIATALLETTNGRVDAYFSSFTGPAAFINENPQFKLRPIGDALVKPTSTAYAVPPGEYHFQQYVNAVLRSLKESEDIKIIAKKWYGDMSDRLSLE
jgi:ABC-type amino acid transport substrate-binding protein